MRATEIEEYLLQSTFRGCPRQVKPATKYGACWGGSPEIGDCYQREGKKAAKSILPEIILTRPGVLEARMERDINGDGLINYESGQIYLYHGFPAWLPL